MIIEELLTLPPWVHFEGITFEFQLINNGGNEMRLVYAITGVDDTSPHKLHYEAFGSWENELADPVKKPTQSFLILFEGIESDPWLLWAVRECWHWLQERGLLSDDNEKIYG
jgi:hypothetical protein